MTRTLPMDVRIRHFVTRRQTITTWEGTVTKISGNDLDGDQSDRDGDGNGVQVPVKERVQQHRARLQNNQRRRLEVTIGNAVIDQMRHIAALAKKRMSSVVQDALESYIHDWH